MPRFVLTTRDGLKGTIEGDEAHHLVRVHRHKVGDVVAVAHEGRVFLSKIIDTSNYAVVLLLQEEQVSPESSLKITLYQGLLKGDKFDFVLAKAVEMGVHRLVPLQCARSVVQIEPDKVAERLSRWQRLATEAAKQCGRAVVPEIAAPERPSEAFSKDAASIKLVAYEKGGRSLKSMLRESLASTVSCVIGTEGGLTEEEVDSAVRSGFIPVTLGPRILRAETAPLCLLSIIMYELGDIG